MSQRVNTVKTIGADERQFLMEVKERLEVGWCQYRAFIPSGKAPADYAKGCVCLDGALRYTLTGNPHDAPEYGRRWNWYYRMSGHIRRAANAVVPYMDWSTVVAFNDATGRNRDEILAVMDYAIEHAHEPLAEASLGLVKFQVNPMLDGE